MKKIVLIDTSLLPIVLYGSELKLNVFQHNARYVTIYARALLDVQLNLRETVVTSKNFMRLITTAH